MLYYIIERYDLPYCQSYLIIIPLLIPVVMITLIGGEKGGTGKTTLCTNLAAMRANAGFDVLIIDADKQGTSNTWSAVRSENEISPRVVCVLKNGDGFIDDVLDLASRYDDVLIDAGGQDSRELRFALGIAEKAFIPLQPSHADVWTLERMEELVTQAQAINRLLEAFVVLNRASTNKRVPETKEAAELLQEYDKLRDSRVVLRDRVVFKRAMGLGMSVEELEAVRLDVRPEQVENGQSKAVAEIRALYKTIYNG